MTASIKKSPPYGALSLLETIYPIDDGLPALFLPLKLSLWSLNSVGLKLFALHNLQYAILPLLVPQVYRARPSFFLLFPFPHVNPLVI